MTIRRKGLGEYQQFYKNSSTFQTGQTYYTDAATVVGTGLDSWSASGGSVSDRTVVSSTAEDLASQVEKVTAEAEADNDRKDDEFRKEAQAKALTISKYCPALAPFAALSLLMVEGAIAISNWLEEDQSSEEDTRASLNLIDRYAQLGLIAPAFDEDLYLGFKRYRQVLETGLSHVAALDEGSQAYIYRMGELMKKHGAKPLLYRFADLASLSHGTVGPGPNYVHGEVAGLIAAAVSIESRIPFERLKTIVTNVMQIQHAKTISDYRHMSVAYAAGCVAALDFAEANAPAAGETITLPSGTQIIASSVKMAWDRNAALGAAQAALAGISPPSRTPESGGGGGITGTQIVVGGGIVAAGALFIAKTAAGSAISSTVSAALRRLFR